MKKNAVTVTALVLAVIGVVLGAIGFSVAVSGQASTVANADDSSTSVLQEAMFTHAEMTSDEITLIPGGLDGSTVGEKRFYSVPATSPTGGMFTGSLTVMAQNTPEAGKEIRETSLVFQMGSINDQIQIGGVAVYDSANPALLPGQVIVRPIVGGTGLYAGATGWCETTHNEDGSWQHVFHYTSTE